MNHTEGVRSRERRCAFLTMQDPGDFVTDYGLAIPPLKRLGWQVDEVSWRDSSIIWNEFDAAYICTSWDYPDDPQLFLDVLAAIDRSRAVLVNPLELVHWTLEKTYLRDLEVRGADIVPSTWYAAFDRNVVCEFFSVHGVDKVVAKPLVGANAADTYVLTYPLADGLIDELAAVFKERPFLVQPFVANIQTEGEFSLFFFAGRYSHAILKTPAGSDFRVQEEHGADIQPVAAPARLVDTATRILRLVEPEPLYARADFVRGDDDRFLLMELELIEPSLYLRTDKDAPLRFADALDQFVRARR